MGNSSSTVDEASSSASPVLPRPKHMLWGCETPVEHYEKIKESITIASGLQGEEGLRRLGFCFRLAHAEPCTCNLDHDEDIESLSDDENEYNDESLDNEFTIQDDEEPFEDEKTTSLLQGEETTEFMVPLEMSINKHIQLEGSSDEADSNEHEYRYLARRQSTMSLFSLATHQSLGSGMSSLGTEKKLEHESSVRMHGHSHHLDHDTCSIRLFHVPSGTFVTEQNHQTFIAHGKMYDELARLCMEYAQDFMMNEANLEWHTLCNQQTARALVSRDRMTSDTDESNSNKKKNVLLVVTGSGKVGAGIFSRRLLMTMGLEPATALPFLREAVRRDMHIVILDPNAQKPHNAMDIVDTSLDKLFFHQQLEGGEEDLERIFVLAHSMAGSQLVRFLLGKTTNAPSDMPNEEGDENMTGVNVEAYLQRFQAVAFTDSNHNINWVKKHPELVDFFEGPRCLYIKSHKLHEGAKKLGEKHHDCQYWHRRFGAIRTLWAGTNEHALTNHTARFHIWEHFDSFQED